MHDYTGIFLNFFLNLNSDWPLLFLIILPIERDWVQKEKYNDLFVRLFDNPLSKYFTFKIISCMQWLFWVIYQYYRGLGLAFAAHSLDDFSKNVLIWYSIYVQSFNFISLFLLRISNKMCYWVILTIDDVMNLIYLRSSSKVMADR